MAEKKRPIKLNPLLGNMLKGFIPMIKPYIAESDAYLTAYLSEIELHEGEIRAAVLCSIGTGCDGEARAYLITCALDKTDRPVRIVNKTLVSEFITQLIDKV